MEQDAGDASLSQRGDGNNTATNAMAGLFGLYLRRDEAEESLGLPRQSYEVPLVLCDRRLVTDGELSYPVSEDKTRPWISEFIGSSILLNRCFCLLENERM